MSRRPRPKKVKISDQPKQRANDKTFYAFAPGLDDDERAEWGLYNPIVLWARNAIEARQKLKAALSDGDDWELVEVLGHRLVKEENGDEGAGA